MTGWRETNIGQLAELVTKGTTPSSDDGGFAESGINYIKSDAVGYDGKVDRSKFVYISEAVHEKYKRSQLKAADILFSMAGAFLGKTGLVCENILPANTNQALAIIRLNKLKASPKFVQYFFRQPTVIDFVNNMSGQSAQPNINFQEIRSIEIELPPLPEQKTIAAVLSSLD
ncbi:MAG: restriction endonuclease subunit S, partial [Saprospiraceae bacterium]|nr:restriction endonuclease subunit S [Saprospiraceae bacterium]